MVIMYSVERSNGKITAHLELSLSKKSEKATIVGGAVLVAGSELNNGWLELLGGGLTAIGIAGIARSVRRGMSEFHEFEQAFHALYLGTEAPGQPEATVD